MHFVNSWQSTFFPFCKLILWQGQDHFSETGKTVNTWNTSGVFIVLWPITAKIMTRELQSQSKSLCLFAIPMLVCKIWSVNCDNNGRMRRQARSKKKKTALGGSVRTIFARDFVGEGTEFVVTKLQANWHSCLQFTFSCLVGFFLATQ